MKLLLFFVLFFPTFVKIGAFARGRVRLAAVSKLSHADFVCNRTAEVARVWPEMTSKFLDYSANTLLPNSLFEILTPFLLSTTGKRLLRSKRRNWTSMSAN